MVPFQSLNAFDMFQNDFDKQKY